MKKLIGITVMFVLVSNGFAWGHTYPDDCNFWEMFVPPTRLGGGETTAGLPTDMKMISIPGGTFSMGSPAIHESPVHYVTLDGFKLSETTVTVTQYVEFLNAAQPSSSDRRKWVAIKGVAVNSGYSDISHIYCSGGNYYADAGWGDHPAANVSWYGAKAFCEHYGLRLPTEAEWEYAAGGPNHYKYPWGDSFSSSKCCYSGNRKELGFWSGPPTMPVKSFSANGYGLYDIAGNVWEWCSDWYDSGYYTKSPSKNPQGPSTNGGKVIRGGSWNNSKYYVRCANRGCGPPEGLFYDHGFRPAGD